MKKKAAKMPKNKLTAEQKRLGKIDIYILVSMIVVGLALAFYNMQ